MIMFPEPFLKAAETGRQLDEFMAAPCDSPVSPSLQLFIVGSTDFESMVMHVQHALNLFVCNQSAGRVPELVQV